MAFDELPHERQLVCLAELAAAALARYGIEAAEAPLLVNLSENATYKVRAEDGGALCAPRPSRGLSFAQRHRVGTRLAAGAAAATASSSRRCRDRGATAT